MLDGEKGIPARVLVLEEQTKLLRQEFHDGFSGLNSRLDALARIFTDKSETNWPTIIAGLALVLTLVGAIGAAYIAPITVGMSYQRQITDLQNKLIDERLVILNSGQETNVNNVILLQKSSAENMEKFKEIETQIRWMSDVANMQKEDSWFRIATLWQKVFSENMPLTAVSNNGPGHL